MSKLLLVLALLLPSTTFAADEVTVYGATWCGPCGAVKAFLSQNGVRHQFVDIDSADGRARYESARGDFRAIPLTTIGTRSVRGANLESLREALQQAKLVPDGAPAGDGKGTTYGGHAPQWWQLQFRQLRAQLAKIDQQIAEGEKVAIDHYEKELLTKLKENREIVSQSIDQLENDASNVSLPRNFRS